MNVMNLRMGTCMTNIASVASVEIFTYTNYKSIF
jgi:hypothetical protein